MNNLYVASLAACMVIMLYWRYRSDALKARSGRGNIFNDCSTLLANGMNNKTIGRYLGISDMTVKVHIKNLLRKLNLTSRLEAAVWKYQNKPKKASDA